MMNVTPTKIQPPSAREKAVLRLMIFIGLSSLGFFLYTMLQKDNISYYPLYVMLLVTMVYYCLKYLHEWYHYFSISSDKTPATGKAYTVDILTTYCAGEPFGMLEDTLTAIQNITYPHTAWCCDEADDPMVKKLCLRLGVKHVTRTNKKDAKAGNINNALQYASGELCVVLDPDHIPAPEFLDSLVSRFDDPSIGFVQIVQAYYNQSESLVSKGAAQQTYQFYGPMMMAMHSYGTVQAIGANCTFRRSALDSIGGHASGLSEDMHTAMQLHARGWRSVYVPVILTRGLVPATMSSYYKQQLKWSRGTWELLLATYPKLFTKFTWRQKLHYFTLPFHYLCGFIFLINFLIPVISLFTGYIPLKMDLVTFLLAAIPLFSMSIIIRQYVQKWVAEEKDRGFHMVGGILQIGTWWIYSIGFIYTILRKKVPYIPTPKNDSDPLPLLASLPNILVAIISLIAIVYGFYHDYNPYTSFMAMLAGMQIIFMMFNLSISGYINNKSKVKVVTSKIRKFTALIVIMHGVLRRYSLVLSCLLILVFGLAYYQQQQLPAYTPRPLKSLQVFYRGIYSNQYRVDTETWKSAPLIASKRKDIAVIAYDIEWAEEEKKVLDTNYLNQIYAVHATPLLVWKPWRRDSTTHQGNDRQVPELIAAGEYDEMIWSFATQLARLNKPVFLSLSNDPVQNKSSFLPTPDSGPDHFIAAWQYIHKFFDKAGAGKVIWIWHPLDATSADKYFPGNKYVDWLGVKVPPGNTGGDQTNAGNFDSIYRPYHLLPLFNSGLPVMITETTSNKARSGNWWNDTWANIDTAFTEIKSVIVGSAEDKNFSRAAAPIILNGILENAPKAAMPLKMDETISAKKSGLGSALLSLPPAMKSVVYDKGFYWFRNKHPMNLRMIEDDISAMKKIGINTIERSMPGFYDKILGQVIAENNFNLISRLPFLTSAEILKDDNRMRQLKENILKVIKDNLDKKYVIAWNLGDDILHTLSNQSYAPDLFYYEEKYVRWLSDLCSSIRQLDSVRPIINDLHWDLKGQKRFNYYKKHVPQINTYMLVADAKYPQALTAPLEDGMVWGKVEVELWDLVPSMKQSGTIPAWQDIENIKFVNLNGLLDTEGRKKQWYGTVLNSWGAGSGTSSPLPDIKILKPAKMTYNKSRLLYHIIYKEGNAQWKVCKEEIPGIHFEWSLIKVDQYGNSMFIKKAGEGISLELSIPGEPQYYRLSVEAIRGEDVKMASTTLNTPLE
ncbi:MAG: glycosyltransferase family 2 protein [Ferruginibacter sp.]